MIFTLTYYCEGNTETLCVGSQQEVIERLTAARTENYYPSPFAFKVKTWEHGKELSSYGLAWSRDKTPPYEENWEELFTLVKGIQCSA